jgi:hypothetical protein
MLELTVGFECDGKPSDRLKYNKENSAVTLSNAKSVVE